MSHYVIVRIDGTDRVVIDRDSGGRIALSMDILDDQGKVIVTLERGHFTVVQANILDVKRPNAGTIIVRDQYKNEVLNATYLNPSSLEVSGLFRYPGSAPVRIPKTVSVDGVCVGNTGSVAIAIRTKR